MIEQRLIHRRHTGHGRGLDALQRLERLPRFEPRQHGNAAAIGQRAVEHADVGEDVEQRQHAHDHVALALLRIDALNLPRVGSDVLVRQFRAFGGAGGAAGVLDQGYIAFRIDHHRARDRRSAQVVPCQQIGPKRHLGQRPAAERIQGQRLDPAERIREPRYRQPFERRAIEHLERCRQQAFHIESDQQPGSRIGDLCR